MTTFDYVVIGVILISGLFAYFRGFVREALSLAAWLLAGVVAGYASPYTVPLFAKFLPPGPIASAVAATVVFVLALLVLHMIANGLARRIRDTALSPVDRAFGLLFGLARGTIIVCLGYLVVAATLPANKDRPRWFADSRSLPYLEAGAGKLLAYIPLPRGIAPRAASNASGVSASEREAESVISAFGRPSATITLPANPAPVYTPDEQRELDRLILQQNSQSGK